MPKADCPICLGYGIVPDSKPPQFCICNIEVAMELYANTKIPECNLCRDTGIFMGEICSCQKKSENDEIK